MNEEIELVVVWHGALHREFPQPQVAVEVPVKHMAERVREYLEERPDEWLTVKAVRMALNASFDDCSDRLKRTADRGLTERRKGEDGRWLYRWKTDAVHEANRSWYRRRQVMVSLTKDRKVRSAAEYAEMRARLERAS